MAHEKRLPANATQWRHARRARVVGGLGYVTLVLAVATTVLGPGADSRFDSRSPGQVSGGEPPVAEVARGPNILVVVTDDQPATGSLKVMPQTRRWFRRDGTTFANAFATTPLCCPARATLDTGRYAHNHGVLVNGKWPYVGRLDQGSTIQRYLHDAGYRTAMLGKYFQSWNRRRPPPHIDDSFLIKGSYLNAYYSHNGTVRAIPGYTTDVLSRRAVRLLHKYERNDHQPWFMWLGTYAPHRPFTPAARHASADVPPWRPGPAVGETDRTDKPPWLRSRDVPRRRAQGTRARQLRTLMSVDEMVGTLFRTLTNLGESRRTLAFFISDNGHSWGEHGILDKKWPYTPNTQIPLLMRWPRRVRAGVTDPRLVANVDVVPTILDAVGLRRGRSTLDGISLLGNGARTRLLLEYWPTPDTPSPPSWAAIRQRGLQYTEWYGHRTGEPVFREFYDLRADPWMLNNLLRDGSRTNDPDVRTLGARLAALRSCHGRSCRLMMMRR